jgi:hypothetical protein
LDTIEQSDPAFYGGMAKGRKKLADIEDSKWDPLFRPGKTTPIHGMLKVAGSDEKMVDKKLEAILNHLHHGEVIVDIKDGVSEPVSTSTKNFKSRIDGSTRPKNGREQ